jgi:acylphosphatase
MAVNSSIERQLVYFSGRVQGVGFRYTTRRIANAHRVTGYVRNLPDGRVEVVAEGNRAEVAGFIQDICLTLDGYIRNRDVHHLDATGEFDGFDIRF